MSVVVRTGLDRIAAGDEDVLRRLRGRKLGLCAHPASVDRQLRHARYVLQDAGLSVRALFGPEHGYGGEAQDMIAVRDGERQVTDAAGHGDHHGHDALRSSSLPAGAGDTSSAHDRATGAAAAPAQAVPVYSLYGASEAALSPTPAQLAGLDAIVIDLQDVGSRYYTFVWTAVLVMRAAAAAGIETIVLDRPNPLGGDIVEGAPQRPGYRSFVGLCDVAVRHGMTIGELCRMAQLTERIDGAALSVIGMQGYSRGLDFEDTGLPWVMPSPNMPTLDTARVYPGGCLLEGTNLSEGRGTTRPFELWGAPFVDAAELARDLHADGCRLRPVSFSPTFHKHAAQRCFGLQVHITDRRTFRPYALYLRLIARARRMHGDALAFRTTPYEFVSDRPAIDLLTGGPEFRALTDAQQDLDPWLAQDAAGAAVFAEQRRAHLLY